MRGGWGRSVIWESHGLRPMKNDNACSLNGQIFEDEDSLQNATESKTNYNPVFEGVISPQYADLTRAEEGRGRTPLALPFLWGRQCGGAKEEGSLESDRRRLTSGLCTFKL